LFGEQVKKARQIQELKLMKLGAFNKINTPVSTTADIYGNIFLAVF